MRLSELGFRAGRDPLCLFLVTLILENCNFEFKLKFEKTKNQNFEQDFKILDRNETEIAHRWNKENLMKLHEKIVYYCLLTIVTFINIEFCQLL